ncbi:MAG TPA: DHH family phosphoesterase [Thermoplasmataceae archaeon]|nr:DHH family phosphoesterase [Thermoplasmatales archaeon AK]HLH85250.1 DHH family phosphoesterase [Thermoplasmataceae archaeon]
MLRDLIGNEFYETLEKSASVILSQDFVRILAHYDGDGGSAAIILANALKRKSIRFHIGYIKNLEANSFRERILEYPKTWTIIVDAGSDQARYIGDLDNILILDHHFYVKSDIKPTNINVRDYGIDGTREACGATMAFLFALAIDETNSDLLPFMMSGAIADKQDIGGFRGLNKNLISHYGQNLNTIRTVSVTGQTLSEAITYSTDPFFLDLSGKPENVDAFLRQLGIEPGKSTKDLSEEERRLLVSALSLQLLSQNAGIEAIKYLESDLAFFDGLGFTSKDLSSIIDGNSKIGANSIPLAYFIGDHSLREEMISNWRIFKTKLVDYIYRTYKEIYEEEHIRYFYAPESEMAGAIGGVLMLYLLRQDKPLIGFNVGTHDTKVSARGPRRLIGKGLNLSDVMKEASTAVGGSGGGHDIAAGAVIPRGKEKQFVEFADRLVATQLGLIKVSQ